MRDKYKKEVEHYSERYIRGTLIEDDQTKQSCNCGNCGKKMDYNSLKITPIEGMKQFCKKCI